MRKRTRRSLLSLLGVATLLAPALCRAQGYTITTAAGGANPQYFAGTGDGGNATSAGLASSSYDVAVDGSGNLYIAAGTLVRKVTPAGIISTVAGGGSSVGDYVKATQVALSPTAIVVDGAGNLFIADSAYGVSRIRRVDTSGTITTVAGGSPCCALGDGGPAVSAYISIPWGLAVDASGNLYIAQADNSGHNLIRKVASGLITTVAGGGTNPGDGGLATSASLTRPLGLAVDRAGNLFIAESGANRVREVSTSGTITTVAGVISPWHVAVDAADNLYVAQSSAATVSLITIKGVVTMIAGTGSHGFSGDGGPALSAMLDRPAGIALGSKGVYVSDATSGIARVRLLTPGACTYSFDQSTLSAGSAAGIGSLALSTFPTCNWSVSSDSTWLTFTSATTGVGSATISYSYTSNTQAASRTGRITANGTTFALTQLGAPVPGPALAFYPVTPCRVADTRGNGKSGAYGPPSMGAGSNRGFSIPNSGCNIPSTAQAYSLNVTVVPTGQLIYLTMWPTGSGQPTVSTLNDFSTQSLLSGNVQANAAIVPAGSNGSVNIFVSDSSDVIIDVNGYFAPPGTGGLSFYPVSPCRVADTRGNGKSGSFGPPTMASNASRSFPIPTSGCNVPSTAQAYSLNMTVVPVNQLTYLTTWPTGQGQPTASTLNDFSTQNGSLDLGRVVANAAIVPAGSSGGVSVFTSDASDLIIDINGYFAPPGGSGALSFYTATPCRLVDTRGNGMTGFFGPPSMGANASRSFPIPQSSCNVPSTAQAYSLNMTVLPPVQLTYLTTWPTGQGQPGVSTLNDFSTRTPALGWVVANAAIVPAGTSGAVSVFTSDLSDVIIDINGYFAP